MPKYRSKPIEIEAVQVNWNNWQKVCALLDTSTPFTDMVKISATEISAEEASDTCGEPGPSYISFKVTTTHGEEAVVRHGDYLISDTKPGTFYPCKPDIFKKKYKPVREEVRGEWADD